MTMIIVAGILVVTIIAMAAFYSTSVMKVNIDRVTLTKNTASTIYSLLLEVASSEQGYVVYEEITPKFTVSLTDRKLTVLLHTPTGNIRVSYPHDIRYAVKSTVSGVKKLCIVKKIVNCTPILEICDAANKTCCRTVENIC